jgi:hypothetical protein
MPSRRTPQTESSLSPWDPSATLRMTGCGSYSSIAPTLSFRHFYLVIPTNVEESCDSVAFRHSALFPCDFSRIQTLRPHPTIARRAKISPFRYRSSKTLKCLRYDEMTRIKCFKHLGGWAGTLLSS